MMYAVYPRSALGALLIFLTTLLVYLHEADVLPSISYSSALAPMDVAFALGIIYFVNYANRVCRDSQTALDAKVSMAIGSILMAIPFIALMITGVLVGAKLDHTLDANWHAVFGAMYGMGLLYGLIALWSICQRSPEPNANANNTRVKFLLIIIFLVLPVISIYSLASNMEHAADAGISLRDPSAQERPWMLVFIPVFITVACIIFSWCSYCMVFYVAIEHNQDIHPSSMWGAYHITSHLVYMAAIMGPILSFMVIVIDYLNGGSPQLTSIFVPLFVVELFLCLVIACKPLDTAVMRRLLMGSHTQAELDMEYAARENAGQTGPSFIPGFRGLSPQEIVALPTHTLNDAKEANEEVCVVCQDAFEVGTDVMTLECKHTLHTHCGRQWLATNAVCPLCKAEVRAAPPRVMVVMDENNNVFLVEMADIDARLALEDNVSDDVTRSEDVAGSQSDDQDASRSTTADAPSESEEASASASTSSASSEPAPKQTTKKPAVIPVAKKAAAKKAAAKSPAKKAPAAKVAVKAAPGGKGTGKVAAKATPASKKAPAAKKASSKKDSKKEKKANSRKEAKAEKKLSKKGSKKGSKKARAPASLSASSEASS